MGDEQDFYTVLGVPRDASGAEIRRAFRAMAKAHHPDSKQAGTGAPPNYDFSLLTEAYETLKDESRRKAYDDELNRARQLAARGRKKRRPPQAFAAGLAVGVLFAVIAIGTKVYLDRIGFRATEIKSQDSLRTEKTDRSVAANPVISAQTATDDGTGSTSVVEEAPAPPVPAKPSGEPTGAAQPASLPHASVNLRQTASLARPQAEIPGPGSAYAEKPSGAPDSPSEPAAGRRLESPPVPPMPAQQSKPAQVTRADVSRPATPHAAFADAVLALERAIDTGGGGVSAYRLVSLVSSATDIDELSRTAPIVSKPETRELIQSRIETLKGTLSEAQGLQVRSQQTAGLARPTAPQDNAVSAHPHAAEGGFIEVAIGLKTAEAIRRLVPGNGMSDSFTDCPNCPEMVVIPSGQAVMGSQPEPDGYRSEETPAHRIYLRRPLSVSKYMISVANWRMCAEAGACPPMQSSLLAVGLHIPATRVSWFDAKAYVEWLSQTTGRPYRLLSEAEWEYAARAGSGRGPSETAARSDRVAIESIRNAGALAFHPRLRPPNGLPQNAWGIHAMGANAFEWVEDCWHGRYDRAPSDASAWLSAAGGDCASRVVRGSGGGAWAGLRRRRQAARAREFADTRSPTLGFRVARELPVPTRTALEVR
jgi:formylglycine-generating enzyme required for sulfatase activity